MTPLIFAAGEGMIDVVEELIGRGADVDARDKVRYLRGYYR